MGGGTWGRGLLTRTGRSQEDSRKDILGERMSADSKSARLKSYRAALQEQQARFRASSPTITEVARSPQDPKGQMHSHLLAQWHEEENLMPGLRGPGGATDFFKTRGIKWWRSYETGDVLSTNGPTRNLTSSQ